MDARMMSSTFTPASGWTCWRPLRRPPAADVVRTGREHPDLLISGGFDKRILAHSKEAIDREVERIMPASETQGRLYSHL
ncbi:MAG: hypothetical protein ACLR23_22715 [Clostridia bacterium]